LHESGVDDKPLRKSIAINMDWIWKDHRSRW